MKPLSPSPSTASLHLVALMRVAGGGGLSGCAPE